MSTSDQASASTPGKPDNRPDDKPVYKDRAYRSPAGLVGGVLLLGLIAWLGGDAVVSGDGRTPWLALASMLVAVPVVVAFSVRPAVFANDDRLRVRNPFRVIELPWASVVSLRSGYTNEVIDESGTKYQLWAIPVSLRGRKKAHRQQAREARRGAKGGGDGLTADAGRPVRAEADQVMVDLRDLCEARAKAAGAQGEPSVRWAWEIVGPAAAGAVLLAVLIALG
ncbi:PH domain-containing protein [Streptomyces sp. 11x1]|uniref:PH domain-containing protein n=1 Tax=Streptomyces sp. 11x1 TaxID=3038642 RepID=UPI00292E302C|nr:PH domain-containing protein [Streptomyces sp. 11x1]WNZ09038.1 PH domain-containing protein [Streptomyces sp. 11x1]